MKSVVQSRDGGKSFQSIGGALLECDLASGQIFGEAEPEAEAPSPAPQQARVPSSKAAPQRPQRAPAPDLTKPGAILKAAKVRIRAIKQELKRHAALKQELAELERLVSAAKAKPKSNVRALRTGTE